MNITTFGELIFISEQNSSRVFRYNKLSNSCDFVRSRDAKNRAIIFEKSNLFVCVSSQKIRVYQSNLGKDELCFEVDHEKCEILDVFNNRLFYTIDSKSIISRSPKTRLLLDRDFESFVAVLNDNLVMLSDSAIFIDAFNQNQLRLKTIGFLFPIEIGLIRKIVFCGEAMIDCESNSVSGEVVLLTQSETVVHCSKGTILGRIELRNIVDIKQFQHCSIEQSTFVAFDASGNAYLISLRPIAIKAQINMSGSLVLLDDFEHVGYDQVLAFDENRKDVVWLTNFEQHSEIKSRLVKLTDCSSMENVVNSLKQNLSMSQLTIDRGRLALQSFRYRQMIEYKRLSAKILCTDQDISFSGLLFGRYCQIVNVLENDIDFPRLKTGFSSRFIFRKVTEIGTKFYVVHEIYDVGNVIEKDASLSRFDIKTFAELIFPYSQRLIGIDENEFSRDLVYSFVFECKRIRSKLFGAIAIALDDGDFMVFTLFDSPAQVCVDAMKQCVSGISDFVQTKNYESLRECLLKNVSFV